MTPTRQNDAYLDHIFKYAKTHKAAFALEFIDLERASGIPGATWEDFQIDFLNTRSRFRADLKSRQVAMSFTYALDAVIDSILTPNTPHVFVSLNLEEAKEKIRYANDIIEAIEPKARPKLLRGPSMTMIEFANKSRLISHPCRPVRGVPRARVYLDEAAHYARSLARDIYKGALPATSKGDGYIRIGSSPFGATGLFWEIVTQSMRDYPGYVRRSIPWWHIRAFCKDVPAARRLAPHMQTADRVMVFARRPLVEIYENIPEEDFRQEYECDWVDEVSAWLSWEMIRKLQDLFIGADLQSFYAGSVDRAMSLLAEIHEAIQEKKIERVLYGGVDVGRRRDLTEFILVGQSAAGTMPLRIRISLRNVEYDAQADIIKRYIKELPIAAVLIDQNGIGNQLAEDLARATGKVQGFTFSNPSKELLAVEAKVQAERGAVPIPLDADLAYQLHSIKKRITASSNAAFDAEANAKHHGDAFWAWALAIWAATGKGLKQGGAW